MKISNYFNLKESIVSETAGKLGLNNTYSTKEHKENVLYASSRMDTIRFFLGVPLKVHSWYRSEEVNKAVKGSKTSSHMQGLAIDVSSNKLSPEEIAMKIRTSGLSYDQIIIYNTFVHFGFCKEIEKERKQILRK